MYLRLQKNCHKDLAKLVEIETGLEGTFLSSHIDPGNISPFRLNIFKVKGIYTSRHQHDVCHYIFKLT